MDLRLKTVSIRVWTFLLFSFTTSIFSQKREQSDNFLGQTVSVLQEDKKDTSEQQKKESIVLESLKKIQSKWYALLIGCRSISRDALPFSVTLPKLGTLSVKKLHTLLNLYQKITIQKISETVADDLEINEKKVQATIEFVADPHLQKINNYCTNGFWMKKAFTYALDACLAHNNKQYALVKNSFDFIFLTKDLASFVWSKTYKQLVANYCPDWYQNSFVNEYYGKDCFKYCIVFAYMFAKNTLFVV